MTRNYILIILDCVRKDYFDQYAEYIQELSDVSFTQCRAASSWSPPSHASLFTGKLPHQHGVHMYNKKYNHIEREDTIFADLPDHTTLAVNANPAVGQNVDKLFDRYNEEIWLKNHRLFRNHDVLTMNEWESPHSKQMLRYLDFVKKSLKHENPIRSLISGFYERFHEQLPIAKLTDDGASKVVDTSLEEIDRAPEPFFMFINFLDAHHNYQNIRAFDQSLHDVDNTWKSSIPEDWGILFNQSIDGFEEFIKNRRELYGAAVDYLDRMVADFVKEVNTMTEHETTFIITADHGDNLGYPEDDYMVHHKSSMTEALLHVPFEIINPPEGYDTQEDELFSHLDLGTLLTGFEREETPDVFRDRVPAERIGTFLRGNFERHLSEAEGYEASDENVEELFEFYDRVIRCVYDGERKYEWDTCGNRIEYEIDFDRPNWQRVAAENVDIPGFAFAFFDNEIGQVKHETRAMYADDHEDLDPETREHLVELGYMSPEDS